MPSRSASSCRRSSGCCATSRSSAGSTTCRSRARISTPATITGASTAATVPHERAHLRSCRAGRPGRPEGLGEHRHLLRDLQSKEGRPDAGRSGDASGAHAEASRVRRRPCASQSVSTTRPRAGATTSTGTSSSTTPKRGFGSFREILRLGFPLRAMTSALGLLTRRITADSSAPAVEGGRIAIDGERFRRSTAPSCPRCASATGARASCLRRRPRSACSCRPGSTADRRRCASTACAGATAFHRLAAPFATGLHQVDNPVSIATATSTSPTAARAASRCRCRSSACAPERYARDVLVGHRQPDVDGVRSGRPALRVEPLRGDRVSR